MIDLNKRLDESVNKVHFYGSWLTYGGLAVIVASIFTFLLEFMRMVHIARMPSVSAGHADLEQLETKLDELERED